MSEAKSKSNDEKFCFMRISIAGAPPETIVIELFHDKCPKTCHNFRTICSSRQAAERGGHAAKEPTYLKTEFHRIVPHFMVQGGDFENFDGTGGYSIYGSSTFNDESFDVMHDKEGILSMANRGKNTNGSQFFITLAPTPHLNGKHVAFGCVVEGMDTVKKMALVETEGTRPVPMQRIIVVDCGVGKGELVISDSNSEVKKKRKKRHKHHDKKKRRRDDHSTSSSEEHHKSRHEKRRKRSRSRDRKDDDRHRHHSKDKKHGNKHTRKHKRSRSR